LLQILSGTFLPNII